MDRVRQRPVRRIVHQIHRWVGLVCGALFVLTCLSGSLLVFYTEIDSALNLPDPRGAAHVTPDWNRALHTLQAAFPEKRGAWRLEVTGDGGAIPARYYHPRDTGHQAFAPMMVWLSPDGGRVIRQDVWGNYLMTWIYDLHFRLLMDRTGALILGYGGFVVLLMLISGMWSWWPRRGHFRKALRVKAGAAQIRRLHDWHKLIGLVSLPMLLLLVVTGIMLELPDESDGVLKTVVSPISPMPKPQSQPAAGPRLPVDAALKQARAVLPDARVVWIQTPGDARDAYRFRMQQPQDPSHRFPHSFVWIDQFDGTVRAVVDVTRATAATTINNWVHPLHDGSAGGFWLRMLVCLAGVLPLGLYVTGLWRWRVRTQREKAKR